MKRSALFTLIFGLLSFSAFSQVPNGVFNKLNEVKSNLSPEAYNPLGGSIESVNNNPQFSEVLEDGWTMDVDRAILREMLDNRPGLLEIQLPINDNRSITLELYRAEVFSGNFTVRSSTGEIYDANDIDVVFYRGTIKGDNRSVVSISVFPNEIRGFVSNDDGDRVLGKLENSDRHVLYFDEDLIPENPVECLTDELGSNQLRYEYLDGHDEAPDGSDRSAADCVKLYLEIENDIVVDFGSVASAVAHVTGIMNEVFTLYENETISMTIEEIFTWNSNDPYDGDSFNKLDTFGDLITMNGGFNGDLAHLIGYTGGGLAWVDVLCHPSEWRRSAYSGIYDNYQSVPTYSWSVEVVTHEIGHNLGSPHTHACAWNGNNTAIDGCGPEADSLYDEGCDGPLPASGTIMSYCHLVGGIGIDFNLGFGTQPGNLIRGEVSGAPCLGSCFCPDLIVAALDSINRDTIGNMLYISAKIKNEGDTQTVSNAIQVHFYAVDDNMGSNPSLIGTTTANTNINPGDSLIVGANFALPGDILNRDYIEIEVDQSDNETDECEEGNNTNIFPNALLEFGCTDPAAHNYDPNAEVDDGTCETCTDGIQNGDEIDVDCGGSLCAPCNCNVAEYGVGSTTFPNFTYPTYEAANVNADDIAWTGLITIASGNGNPLYCLGFENRTSGSINLSDYMQFGVAPTGGGWIDLLNVKVDLYKTSSGPTNWEVRSSDDGYASTLGSGTFNTSWTTETIDLSSIGVISGGIDFRLYMWGAPIGADHYGFMDNFSVCGEYFSCTDGIQNGDETGVDCGGTYCDPCVVLCPDLIINWMDPTRVDASDSIFMEVQVENIGTEAVNVPFDIDFYMSTNNTLEAVGDAHIGSSTVNIGSLAAGATYTATVMLDDVDLDYLIGAVDYIDLAISECNEGNNQSVMDYETCITTVSNTYSGAPGSFRWAAECTTQGGTLSFSAGVQGDTFFIRNIDPISIPGDLMIDGDYGWNLYLAPHPDNTGTGPEFEFNGTTEFDGLNFIPFMGRYLRGDLKSGGEVEFTDSEIKEIDLKQSP